MFNKISSDYITHDKVNKVTFDINVSMGFSLISEPLILDFSEQSLTLC